MMRKLVLGVALAGVAHATPQKDKMIDVLLEKVQNQEDTIKELEARLDGQTESAAGRKLLFGYSTTTSSSSWTPLEPIIPGMKPGSSDKPRILLGIDVDYPPYATLVYPPDATDIVVGGFGPDVAEGLMEVCDIEITTIQAGWEECWDYDDFIGSSLLAGYYMGCETYTHTVGVRNRYVEFSDPILDSNKEAGIMARLDMNMTPMVSPSSDLSDVTIIDVSGWAPTADSTVVLTNDCTGDYFTVDISGTGNVIGSADIADDCTGDFCDNANDVAIYGLFNMNASSTTVYLYADQAYNYMAACAVDETLAGVNCDLWNQLGQPGGYAFIHMGMPEFAYAGTTLSLSKKGSGLSDILNPCIALYLETESYYDVCNKWNMTESCFANEYFPDHRRLLAKDHTGKRHVGRRLASADALYNIATDMQADDGCGDGYCSCSD